jgi:CP family cyanate transporter-like MFS transporter
VTRTATDSARSAAGTSTRGLWLIGIAIVLTALNLRTAVNSVGPVLQELQDGLQLSSGLAGVVTALPVLCFAALGFAGPPLSARYRDSYVLAGAMTTMAAGLVLRGVAGSFWLFLVGTVMAMTGGALGNVLLPSLVKRYFPHRTGLLVGAYSTAMSIGGAVVAVVAQPIADAAGADGWRWAMGVWAVPAFLAALVWVAVPGRPAPSRGGPAAVRIRSLLRSRTAVAMALFFGIQALECYVIVGWAAQYLRDEGLSATAAGLLLSINLVMIVPVNMVVPALTVRVGLQRPLLAFFLACYGIGWLGLWVSPLSVPWLWMGLLGVAMGTFAMVLTLIGLRSRTAETTAALSTATQGWGYLIAGAGPLLVGVLRGITGSYTGMFVLVMVGVVLMAITGWLVTRQGFVDDEVAGWSSATPREDDVIEVAGAEPPAAVHVTTDSPKDAASPRG